MKEEAKKVVTRFAPSPTGFMHVGGVRTALFAWLFARKNKGTFILRIEDTDKGREVEGSADHIIASLRWLGIEWDEGIDIGGPHAPYLQSERLESYKKYAALLIEKGYAYPDPYTPEEVEAFRQKAEEEKRPFLFRDHRPEKREAWDGTRPLRFKVPVIKRYEWKDIVYGDLSAGEEALDDFILIKSDGYPTYNFAHIIDDLEMGVTHILRASEFISSMPKFLSLYDALEIPWPVFATLPPIMAPDGKKKLGKRDGAKDILDYKAEGYLPEAMMNFLAFLGWNPGGEKEIFSKEELIEAFSLEKIGHSGSGFNEEKLLWFNREHMKLLREDTCVEGMRAFLPEDFQKNLLGETFKKAFPFILERLSTFAEARELLPGGELGFFFTTPTYETALLIPKDKDRELTKTHLETLVSLLEPLSEWNPDTIKNAVWDYATEKGRGEVLWPMRVALSGLSKSPDPFSIAYVIGKEETLTRLAFAGSHV